MQSGLALGKITIDIAITQVQNPLAVIYWAGPATVSVEELSNGMRKERFEIDLAGVDHIELEMQGKGETDTKVDEQGNIIADAKFDIRDIWIDGILIEPWALGPLCKYYPIYTQGQRDYANANQQPLEEFLQDEWTFYFNGRWHFDLKDFFLRYNRILSSGLDHYNHWVKQSHLGYIDSDRFAELESILKTL